MIFFFLILMEICYAEFYQRSNSNPTMFIGENVSFTSANLIENNASNESSAKNTFDEIFNGTYASKCPDENCDICTGEYCIMCKPNYYLPNKRRKSQCTACSSLCYLCEDDSYNCLEATI